MRRRGDKLWANSHLVDTVLTGDARPAAQGAATPQASPGCELRPIMIFDKMIHICGFQPASAGFVL